MLEGTLGPNGKSITAVGAAQLKILRAAREEVNHYMRCTLLGAYLYTMGPFFPARLPIRVGEHLPERNILDTRQLRRLPLLTVTSSADELKPLSPIHVTKSKNL